MLRVSKQLRDETAPIAYGQHKFSFFDMGGLHVFLDAIGDMVQYIRHLSLGQSSYMSTKTRSIFNLLKNAKSLHTFSIPHELVCLDKVKWVHSRWRSTTVYRLVSNGGPMLKALYKARKTNENAASALDIFKIRDITMCYQCKTRKEMPGYKCTDMCCGYPCESVEQHNDDVEAKMHAAVKQELDIEESEEESE